MARPVLFVLAGVNGAGKSSVGGHLLQRAGLAWFNPDSFARELVATTGFGQSEANAAAWHEGLRRLNDALAHGRNHVFETTLGGNTIPARIQAAAGTHDVMVWYCGLASPEHHLQRVRARVMAGGHDIPEVKVRERYVTALQNLITLLPHIAHLQVYDNSAEAAPGEPVPDPLLVAEMHGGQLRWPTTLAALRDTPQWARPLLEAALSRTSPGWQPV